MTQLGIYICTPLIKEKELFSYKNLYVKFMYVELYKARHTDSQ